jgi:NAD(P)-dependent dehydrogenase (short-subunit alcohol dehydrogenase family)
MGITTVAGKTVLVTGANRGIGQALVQEALSRGAARVYAGTRQPLDHADERVIPLLLDITDPDAVRAAAAAVPALDLLINNAGVAVPDDLSDREVLEQHLAVNLFGTWSMSRAFSGLLAESGGAIVNVLSLAGLAPIPIIPAYSISKAAAFSLTQSLRIFLAPARVSVHGVLTGPTDTEMSRSLEIPKAPPASVARAIFDGVEGGVQDIFPDPMSAAIGEGWSSGPIRALERMIAGPAVDADPAVDSYTVAA